MTNRVRSLQHAPRGPGRTFGSDNRHAHERVLDGRAKKGGTLGGEAGRRGRGRSRKTNAEQIKAEEPRRKASWLSNFVSLWTPFRPGFREVKCPLTGDYFLRSRWLGLSPQRPILTGLEAPGQCVQTVLFTCSAHS